MRRMVAFRRTWALHCRFAQRVARHPIVGDDVVIHAGATISGRVTIGDRTVTGGNVRLLQDVAANSVIAHPEAVPAGV